MTHYRANNYDLVLEVHETAINDLINTRISYRLGEFLGTIRDESAGGSISFLEPGDEALSQCSANLDTRIENGIYLTVPFYISLEIENPAEWPRLGIFEGLFRITARLAIHELSGTTACLAINFEDMERDQVEVELNDPLPEEWRPFETNILNILQSHVYDSFQNLMWEDIPDFDIDIDPENDGSFPFVPTQLSLRTIHDGSIRSAIILMNTQPDIPDNADAFTESNLGPGDQTVAIIGNEVLLRRFIGARILTNLNIYNPHADSIDVLRGYLDYHDNQVTLAAPIDATHIQADRRFRRIEISTLTIAITETEQLDARIELNAYAEPFSGRINLHFTGELENIGGDIVIHLHVDEPEVHISPTGVGFLMMGLLAFFIFAFRKLASRLFFAMVENIFPDSECSLVGMTDWPDEPQAIDLDCEWLPPFSVPLTIDHVTLDDCALVGRLDLPDLDLEWPQARVSIIGNWEVSDGRFDDLQMQTYDAGWGFTANYIQVHHGEFWAIPSGPTVFPIKYYWCINGHELTENGSIAIGGATVTYTTENNYCEITLEAGDSLQCELCVIAIDSRDVEIYAQKPIDIQGTEPVAGFFGIDVMKGPPPELEKDLYASLPARGPEVFQDEVIDLKDYKLMMRSALKNGVGVDPADPNLRIEDP